MPDDVPLLYLEPDDEITAVVRRVREADADRVVLIAPGRSKVTASAVSLRLLARLAADEGRSLALVADAAGRSLAAEVGIPAYLSVEDARRGVEATAPAERRQASIHVVRGDEPTLPIATVRAPSRQDRAEAAADEATRSVPVAAAAPRRPARRPSRRARRNWSAAGLAILVIAFAGVLVVGAVLLPAATIQIVRASGAIGPVSYELTFDEVDRLAGEVTTRVEGTATGSYTQREPARGVATFRNFNIGQVEVPAGTRVAAGETVFVTIEGVAVPPGELTGAGTIRGGEGSAAVVAEAPGPGGNVVAEAIDTILDQQVVNRLRGFPQNRARLVINYDATAGGIDQGGPVIEQADVDAAVDELRSRLATLRADELTDDPALIQLDLDPAPEPVIELPEDLAGARDRPTFEMSGSLAYDRVSLARTAVEDAARERLLNDPSVVPAGRMLLPETIEVSMGAARRDGERILVAVVVDAVAAAQIDEAEVVDRVAGMPVDQAQAALADLGEVTIEAWPGWVDAVPGLTWRIEVSVTAAEGT